MGVEEELVLAGDGGETGDLGDDGGVGAEGGGFDGAAGEGGVDDAFDGEGFVESQLAFVIQEAQAMFGLKSGLLK